MNLISKKDLLAITGISYGQLYRWKRERLIPEEWFIKQSAYTGQETFFPREQILSRIQSILDLKDKYSLEELAKILSPGASTSEISFEDLKEIKEINPGFIKLIPEVFGKNQYDISEAALMAAISQAAGKLGFNEEQYGNLLHKSISAASGLKSINVVCTIFFTGREYHTMFTPNAALIAFDDSIEIKEQITLSEIADNIKLKYKSRFI